jgi:hypothetical protein
VPDDDLHGGGSKDLSTWRDGAGGVRWSLLCGIVASGVVDERVAYGGNEDLAWHDRAGGGPAEPAMWHRGIWRRRRVCGVRRQRRPRLARAEVLERDAGGGCYSSFFEETIRGGEAAWEKVFLFSSDSFF